MEDADGETCWRCMSFLDRFLFVFALITHLSMYKTSECLEDLVQCLVSTHDENVPLASAPKCD